ncbi:MAG: hypothetical protein WCH43_12345 [Verrucomicrobiota bacterium]
MKSHSWSDERDASGLEYVSYVNHTGYWTVKLPDGTETQVDSSTIATTLNYPLSEAFSIITKENEVADVTSQIVLYKGYAEKYPKIRKFLTPRITALEGEVARYQGGERKYQGVWHSQADYSKLIQQEASKSSGIQPGRNQDTTRSVAQPTGTQGNASIDGTTNETHVTFRTNSGVWYRNVKVISNDGTGITVELNDGITRVNFNDLPQNIQMQFNHDPEKQSKPKLEK